MLELNINNAQITNELLMKSGFIKITDGFLLRRRLNDDMNIQIHIFIANNFNHISYEVVSGDKPYAPYYHQPKNNLILNEIMVKIEQEVKRLQKKGVLI